MEANRKGMEDFCGGLQYTEEAIPVSIGSFGTSFKGSRTKGLNTFTFTLETSVQCIK